MEGGDVEDGRWKMEDGRWKMEDGRWKMEDGGWRMEDGGSKQTTTPSPRPSPRGRGGTFSREAKPRAVRRSLRIGDWERGHGVLSTECIRPSVRHGRAGEARPTAGAPLFPRRQPLFCLVPGLSLFSR